MGKALKTVGAAILVAGLAVVTGGAALAFAPAVGVGLTSAVGLGLTATTLSIGGFTVSSTALLATGAALTAASSMQQPAVKSSGASINWTADPDAPIPFAFGRVGAAGKIVHNTTYGPDQMYAGFVGVLSGAGPIDGYEGFTADDKSVSFDSNGMAISSEYANEMWLKRQVGAQPTSTAMAVTGLKNSAAMPGWSASSKLNGKAAYVYVLGENSKGTAYKGKVPTGVHTLRGLRCWDPRLDSTYPGGSGTCRLNNPATWVYTTNAYLHALKWVLGLWEGPTGKGAPAHDIATDYQVGGIGARVGNVSVQMYVDAANAFDENADWDCAAWPTTEDEKAAVLDSFLQAGGGIYAQVKGKYGCVHRIAPRPSVATITGADTAGPIELTLATPRKDRINTLRPRYWSAAHKWTMTPAGEVTNAVWQEEDGQGAPVKKTRSADFNYVPNAKQAVELAALQIAHTREGIKGVIPLRPYMMGLDVGDCITLSEPDFVLDGQKVLILDIDDQTEADVIRVSFTSETDEKYDYAYGRIPNPPPAPSLEPGDPTFVTPPEADEWTLSGTAFTATGGTIPALVFEGEVENPTADGVIFEYRPVGAGVWSMAGEEGPLVERKEVTSVTPQTAYEAAIRYRRGNNFSDRLVLGPVTTGDLTAGGAIVSAYLTNESHTVPATSAGVVDPGDLADAGGAFRVLSGSVDVTESATYSVQSESGLDASINSSGVYTIASMSADSGQATFRATYNGVSVDRVYSLTKSKQGSGGGESAKTLQVSSDRQIILFDGDGNPNPAVQTIAFTASKQNTTATVTWSVTDITGAAKTPASTYLSAATGNSVTMTVAQFNAARGSTTGVIVTGTLSDGVTLSDRISVLKVQDGPGVDDVTPAAPTGLVLAGDTLVNEDGSTSIELVASWNAVSGDDITYKAQLRTANGSRSSPVIDGTETRWRVGTGAYTVRVWARSKYGTPSATYAEASITATKDTTPPASITAGEGTSEIRRVSLRWTNPTAADFKHVEIRRANNSAGTASTKLGETSGTSFNDDTGTVGTAYYYFGRTYDRSGNTNGVQTLIAGPIASRRVADDDFDDTDPNGPGSVSAGGDSGVDSDGRTIVQLALTWPEPDAVPGVALDGYQVEALKDGEVVDTRFTRDRTVKFPVASGPGYSGRVTAVSTTRRASAPVSSSSVTVNGDTTPPGVLTSGNGKGEVGRNALWWTNPTDSDFARVDIYRHTSNVSGAAVKIGEATGSVYADETATAGIPYWYWGVTKDRSGNGTVRTLIKANIASLGVPDNSDTTPPATPVGLTVTALGSIDTTTGLPITRIRYAWTANTETDLDGYELVVRESGQQPRYFIIPGDRSTIDVDAVAGRTYAANLKAFDKSGNKSSEAGFSSITPAKDAVAPSAPTWIAVEPAFDGLRLRFTAPTAADTTLIQVWEHTANASGSAVLIDTMNASPGQTGAYLRGGLGTGETRYYWLKAIDSSGNISVFSAGASGTSRSLDTIDFPQDVRPPQIVDTLPSSGNFYRRSVILRSDGKLYRWSHASITTGTAHWNKDVDGADLILRSVGADAIAARAILATNLYLADFTNMVADANMVDPNAWTGAAFTFQSASGVASPGQNYLQIPASGTKEVRSDPMMVEGGLTYYLNGGAWVATANTARAVLLVEWYSDAAGTALIGSAVEILNRTQAYSGASLTKTQVTAPANAQRMRTLFRRLAGPSGDTAAARFAAPIVRKAAGGELIVDGGIEARHVKAQTFTGSEFRSDANMPASLTIGTTGFTLGNAAGWAENPAARINSKGVQINPGLIAVWDTTLANMPDWRFGPNLTLIDGGNLAANTIRANALEIGMRGVELQGVRFEHNSPSANAVSWTAGTILWFDDSGSAVATSLSAGSITGITSRRYIYWTKGSSSLSATSSLGIAGSGDNVVLAVYAGGTDLTVNYGRTTIDRDGIKTNAVTADKLFVSSLSAITGDVGVLTAGKLRNSAATYEIDLTLGLTTIKHTGGWTYMGVGIGPANQEIEYWSGPAGTTVANANKGNARLGMSRNTVGGPRFFGSDAPTSGGASAKSGRYGGRIGMNTSTGFVDLDGVTDGDILTFTLSGTLVQGSGSGGKWEIWEQTQSQTGATGVKLTGGNWGVTGTVGGTDPEDLDGSAIINFTSFLGTAPRLTDEVRTTGDRRYRLVLIQTSGTFSSVVGFTVTAQPAS